MSQLNLLKHGRYTESLIYTFKTELFLIPHTAEKCQLYIQTGLKVVTLTSDRQGCYLVTEVACGANLAI